MKKHTSSCYLAKFCKLGLFRMISFLESVTFISFSMWYTRHVCAVDPSFEVLLSLRIFLIWNIPSTESLQERKIKNCKSQRCWVTTGKLYWTLPSSYTSESRVLRQNLQAWQKLITDKIQLLASDKFWERESQLYLRVWVRIGCPTIKGKQN